MFRSVRGPNSALTEFLRSQNIDANSIRLRYAQLQEEAAQELHASREASAEPGSSTEAVAGAAARRLASRRKKKKLDEDRAMHKEMMDQIHETAAKPRPGQMEFCAECSKRFAVSVYTKAAVDGDGLLCHSCGSKYAVEEKKQKKTQMASRKKRKSVAAALLDRQDAAVPKLQDMCIKLIAKYIDDVDALGDIGEFNMEKISRILARNRSLTDSTFNLFLGVNVKRLQFWDCSNLSAASLEQIGAFCPALESLTLVYCGQITDSVIDYYSTNLRNLHSLIVDGAFLVRSECWVRFFKALGTRLTRFSIGNTLRFNRPALESLAENCGSVLEELKLSRIGSLTSDDLTILLRLEKLNSVELSYMESTLTDSFVIELLQSVGPQLLSLNLDDCGTLSDAVLVQGIRPYCGFLQNLSLALGSKFTDDGFSQLFTEWSEINNGLINVNLARCTEFGDAGCKALIDHSGKTLVILNINSDYSLSASAFHHIADSDCEFLSQLDVGFVQAVGDREIELLCQKCPSLQLVEVYGAIRITEVVQLKPGIKLIGRQSDTL
ncbi:uncharacterized protein V1516DRAFT_630888 [Lipomyces oligophaga]|uniref:uncharacterized protein n=1 Tax=Lipomyces oligophaga TaxID=45792 RepID=UPI0034CF144B